MAVNEVRRWLIAYDICNERRLRQVHRLLSKTAVPVQYSVFATCASTTTARQLASTIEDLIDTRADDVRLYPIPETPLAFTIGATMLPESVMLLDDRRDLGPLLGRQKPG